MDQLFPGCWNLSPVDGLPYDPRANPQCQTCSGHGVVDTGDWCCELDGCPDCIKVDVPHYSELGSGE